MIRIQKASLVATLLFFSTLLSADEKGLKISDIPAQEGTSVVIKKGEGICGPDYEVISGSDEVVGDPSSGEKESYASWKVACEAWKKEVKEVNRDNQLLSLNCAMPVAVRLNNGTTIYHSSATFKVKTKIRNGTSTH
jgi:invasion protein IalB